MNTYTIEPDHDARYGGFSLNDGAFLVYDRENSDAWISCSETTDIRL